MDTQLQIKYNTIKTKKLNKNNPCLTTSKRKNVLSENV